METITSKTKIKSVKVGDAISRSEDIRQLNAVLKNDSMIYAAFDRLESIYL